MDLIEIARYHDYNQEDTFLPKHIEGSGAGQTIHELLKVIFKQRAEIADLKTEVTWHETENKRLTDKIEELKDDFERMTGGRPE